MEEEETAVAQHQKLSGLFSCWGKLRLASLWRSLRRCGSRRGRLYVKPGSFRYDPVSYSQNFDDGGRDGDEEWGYHRVFPSRLAAVHPPTPPSGPT
ncbi:hypothetical protein OPV22_001586 [Ensete ventricosum]|uniref:Uncharacterized protein n=1 Tax=Ensete ventricosum TaxID=4639 RepID=A0AAV8RQG9_ENSVE|nr:hypothetical protein OPV22_001586 [Ensete ventricosum]RWV99972.1 hypothetical protein GW17_00037094 [Ensete ventricosum]RZR80078.1 hypothetical protein BHM03_00005988 [Ensete ventricosum]